MAYYPGDGQDIGFYTPLARVWYHKAKKNDGRITFVEPYTDASPPFTVLDTVSVALYNNSRFVGVAGVD